MCLGRKRTLANGILIRVLNRGVRIPRVGGHCRNMAEPSRHSAWDCGRLTGKPEVGRGVYRDRVRFADHLLGTTFDLLRRFSGYTSTGSTSPPPSTRPAAWPSPWLKTNSIAKSKISPGPKLLILDEVGYLPLHATQASLLFQILCQPHEKGQAIVLTSNKAFSDWGQIFANDPIMASDALDRLLHRCTITNIHGDSYRQRKAIKTSFLTPAEDEVKS